MLMNKLKKIMNSYVNYFNLKDINLQMIITDDMYECQKNYGFSESDLRANSAPGHQMIDKKVDEEAARANWKHVAACMKYPKDMSEPFTLIFKRPYLQRINEAELYRLVFHELTHYVDYVDYAKINNLTSYQQLFKSQQTVLFQNWSEYHAERRGYAAYLKRKYGIKLQYDATDKKVDIMHKETINNFVYYAEHFSNTAEYGAGRQVYFTMHLLARTTIWMQILPYQVSDILTKDPFNYRGMEWIKKLMNLFVKYPNIQQITPHFMDIARIIAENLALKPDEIYEQVACNEKEIDWDVFDQLLDEYYRKYFNK